MTARGSRIVLCALLLGAPLAQGQSRGDRAGQDRQAPPPAQAEMQAPGLRRAADAGLGELRRLAAAGSFRELGFESAGEARGATLGAPLPVYLVRLDALRKYEAGADPERLLTRIPRLLIPVLIGGRARSSIALEGPPERLAAVSFGSPALIEALVDAARQSAERSGVPPRDHFLVHVAALNAYYVGHREGSALVLTAVDEDAASDLAAGGSAPAARIFAALAATARSANGLPR
jgi:hypothetical protein